MGLNTGLIERGQKREKEGFERQECNPPVPSAAERREMRTTSPAFAKLGISINPIVWEVARGSGNG